MLKFLQFSQNVSETFTHSLPMDPFNVYMHSCCLFDICIVTALDSKNRHFSRFPTVVSLLPGVTRSKAAIVLL